MTNLSERLELLMNKAKISAREVRNGRYTNGSYSSSAGNTAIYALDMLEKELLELMKQALRSEAYNEAREMLVAQISVSVR
jgi:hypothetical protein